jgi:hypothetical protein
MSFGATKRGFEVLLAACQTGSTFSANLPGGLVIAEPEEAGVAEQSG